jgi:hypothetical protein
MSPYGWESCLSRVLRFHRVQSRQSEDRWRLDRPYCGGNCCDIPGLVDAATLCAVAPACMLLLPQQSGTSADAARVRALAAYKGFLTLWKDADPDIAILTEAKAEYAKLQ